MCASSWRAPCWRRGRGCAAPAPLQRYALGPTLGQCCGGVVHLAFELVDAGLARRWLARRRSRSDTGA
jgi:xanthine dehydrogenase accessory factor